MRKVVDEVVDANTAVDNQNISGIGLRMKAARDVLGLTQDGLAKAVGGSKRGIQENEARNRVPGGEVVFGMVRLGINANWLLTGQGPMLLAELQGKTAPASATDWQVMGYVIDEVDRVLKAHRLTLAADKKIALIQVLYDYCVDTGKQESGTVERFLKLVA